MGYRISSWNLRGLASDSFVIIRQTSPVFRGEIGRARHGWMQGSMSVPPQDILQVLKS